MSDLKYMTIDELKQEVARLKSYIKHLEQKKNNASVRLEWAEKYIFQKTPQRLSLDQIEAILGHKVIIKF